jgi:hypothetical protein
MQWAVSGTLLNPSTLLKAQVSNAGLLVKAVFIRAEHHFSTHHHVHACANHSFEYDAFLYCV